jgi:hypothetical protein
MSDFSFSVESQYGQAQPLLAQAHDYYKYAAEQGRADEESRSAHILPELILQMIYRSETCQRCGLDLSRVFIWNNQRLCKKCFGEGQDSWEVVSGESRGAETVLVKAAEPDSALGSFMSRLLGILGVKKAPSREPLFAWPRTTKLRAGSRASKDVDDKHQMPRSEGLMNRKKKKRKKQC